jgi:hypothetical protein
MNDASNVPVRRLSPLGLAALSLSQEYGFALFPIRPRDKRPLEDGGFHAATTHPEKIAEWWDRYPTANIGLYPGASQLLVLDVDGPEGEERSRAAGAFAELTLEVITRRGMHRYFRLPPSVIVGNVAGEQLDVRAHNGYVLVPPSVHETGHVYAWRGDLDAIADVPPGVLALIRESERTPHDPQIRSGRFTPPPSPRTRLDQLIERRVIAYTDRVGYGLSDGRKTAAYRLACFYRFDVGLADDLAWHCLAAWNRVNSPALHERILADIHANAGKYARGAA